MVSATAAGNYIHDHTGQAFVLLRLFSIPLQRMVRNWFSRSCPLRSSSVAMPAWLAGVEDLARAGGGGGGHRDVLAPVARVDERLGDAAGLDGATTRGRDDGRNSGDAGADGAGGARSGVDDTSREHGGPPPDKENAAAIFDEEGSDGTDASAPVSPAADESAALGGTEERSPSPSLSSSRFDDGEMDDELAAWCEFQEERSEDSVGTTTPLGSASSSEAPAGEHPLDESFYDEVFSRDETQVGASLFHTKEDFFAFILISSTVGLTERQYNINRSFYNTDRSRQDALPGYTTTTRRIIPAAIKAGGLSMECLSVEGAKCWYVLPRTHVARDLAFKDTHDLFFAAEDRPSSLREQEPEFYDTMFFQNKAALLQPVLENASFHLNGTKFRRGSRLFICLSGSNTTMSLLVEKVFIASAESGVDGDHGRHAGDLVIICHTNDGVEAGALVSRHWLPAEMELDALVWMPADNSPTCAVLDLSLATSVESLDDSGDHAGGAYPHYSSATRRIRGVGPDGVPTLVVCIALYADDFVCRERGHQSAGGVYMYYPGWCVSARMSSSAVRTISVTPAGVNSDKVLEAITSDLVEGTTTGWALTDCHGSSVRVVLDVCFFVGDYVQVSKSGRMRGHNAMAPCSLCAYSLPGGEGSQYAGPGSAADTGLMRTTARTTAVLDAVRYVNE